MATRLAAATAELAKAKAQAIPGRENLADVGTKLQGSQLFSDGDVDASGKSEGRRKVSRKRRFKGKVHTRSVQVEKAKTGLLVNR